MEVITAEIVEATSISQGTVFSILQEKLGVKKISARWVPRLLSEENKRNRVVDSEAILVLYRRSPDELNEEVIAQIDDYFEDLPKSYFLDGSKKLEKRLEKCIELKGDYVEK